MAYKDKDKQREAQRERTRRYRAKQKGVTSKGVTGKGVTITTETVKQAIKGLPDYDPVKPKALDPEVQAIWDRRNAQGQPTIYTEPMF